MTKINAQKLKGFRDFYGKDLKNRLKVLNIFRETYESYGFMPLETPTLEYYELLNDKYGEDEKLIYNFTDFGDRHVAMRYDLTVPTARFYIENQNDLKLPWKRYQIQPVWRADNTQKGRFREFYQCDADVIGAASLVAEVEYITMGIEILEKLGFKKFIARLNNRKILNALAESLGRKEKFADIVSALDKWEKRSIEKTEEDLIRRGLSKEETTQLITLVQNVLDAKNEDRLDMLEKQIGTTEEGKAGIEELKFIINNVNSDRVVFDLSIARGLAYYTGPIWEWNILEGDIGSVGGCGRYDKLIGNYTGKDIPATGGSFGIERILEVMIERDMFKRSEEEPSKVLVTVFDEEHLKLSLEVFKTFKSAGIVSEIYSDIKPLKKQFEYANNLKFDFVVIIGDEEGKNGKLTLKDMNTGVQEMLSVEEVMSKIKS